MAEERHRLSERQQELLQRAAEAPFGEAGFYGQESESVRKLESLGLVEAWGYHHEWTRGYRLTGTGKLEAALLKAVAPSPQSRTGGPR